jgi:ketosteroid isomerase-like protein
MPADVSQAPRDVVERWYTSLSARDFAAYAATLHEDVIINVAGRTAVSGRWHGKTALFDIVLPRVVANLDVATIDLARHWRIMGVDGSIVTGMMQGGATNLDGETYEQTYCQIFRVEQGLIVESWEFFDTIQAEARLFGKSIDPGAPCTDPLRF